MAKDKSKDEIQADIAERETEDVTTEQAAKTETPVKRAGSNRSAEERVAKKIDQEGGKDGTTQKSSTAKAQADDQEKPEEIKTTKAGKRSAKALKEAEEKLAKEERKARQTNGESAAKPKPPQKPPRTKLERRGKKFQAAAKQIEKDQTYSLQQALELATKTSPVKFDATVELHLRLNVDPRQADQNVRDTVTLPAGTGKTVRVAVFADVDDIEKAKRAGADIATADEFLQQLDQGQIDFDVLVATPAVMPRLGKYARLLGPKGLMPNPKSGTVTSNVGQAVKEAKAGRVEYRVDSSGIVHVSVGKVSFGAEKLTQNTRAILGSIKSNKPASVKGPFVRSIYVTTTMGPAIAVAPSEL